jgi:signal peptidase II
MRQRLPYLALAMFIAALDQFTKWLIVTSLELYSHRPILDGVLGLSHIRNFGAAFGVLSDARLPYQPVLFAAVSLLALAAVTWYALRVPLEARLPHFALALVLGGAIGNLIDRFRLGYVVDFIHVYWRQWSWPDFNLADSAISVGVSLLILDLLLSPAPASRGAEGQALSPALRND